MAPSFATSSRSAVGADGREDSRARDGGDLHRGGPDPAVRAVDDEKLARAKPCLRHHRIVRRDEDLGDGRSGELVEPSGTAATCRSCTRTRSASPPPPTIPKTRSPGANRRAVGPHGDHGPGYLDPGNVGRRAGRSGVAALALREVGGVQPGVADGDEDVVAGRNGIGPLDEIDDLVAAGTAEDDRTHLRGAYATGHRPGRYACAFRRGPFVDGRAPIPGGLDVARSCLRPNLA